MSRLSDAMIDAVMQNEKEEHEQFVAEEQATLTDQDKDNNQLDYTD